MKTKVVFFIILSISMIFLGCFSPWAGGEGALTINVGGNGQARDGATNGTYIPDWLNDVNFDHLLHVITVTKSDGQKHEKRFMGHRASTSFNVATGYWNVAVKAYDMGSSNPPNNQLDQIDIKDKELMAEGFADIDVRIGDNPVKITMGLPKYEVKVGVIRGQDGKTLTKEKWGSVSVTVNDNLASPSRQEDYLDVYTIVKGANVVITPTPSSSPVASYKFGEWRTKHRYEEGESIENAIETIDNIKKDITIGYAYFKPSGDSIKIIKSVEDLAEIGVDTQTFPLYGNYVLVADLDFNDLEKPIPPIGVIDGASNAGSTAPFTGTFDGMGHTINLGDGSKVNISNGNGSDYQYKPMGLFGVIGDVGTVKNIIIKGVLTSNGGMFYAGAVAGENNGNIQNVVSYVTINNSIDEVSIAGGIAGLNTGNIKNCASMANIIISVSSDYDGSIYGGGIVGLNNAGIGRQTEGIEYCWASGVINASKYFAGGIAGANQYDGVIKNCVALNGDNNIYSINTGRIVGNNGSIDENNLGELANNYANFMKIKGNDVYPIGADEINGATFTNNGANSWKVSNSLDWSRVLGSDENSPWVLPASPANANFRPKLWFEID